MSLRNIRIRRDARLRSNAQSSSTKISDLTPLERINLRLLSHPRLRLLSPERNLDRLLGFVDDGQFSFLELLSRGFGGDLVARSVVRDDSENVTNRIRSDFGEGSNRDEVVLNGGNVSIIFALRSASSSVSRLV